MKVPATKHHVHKEVDPQSTQHHRDVQRVIDTPQQPPATQEGCPYPHTQYPHTPKGHAAAAEERRQSQ
ncbi:MAG: hypothetical protein M3Z54_07660 [Gemmatimonadota bacterium]|nr:hypothetical protein [Gemmatimonadota bacterium]